MLAILNKIGKVFLRCLHIHFSLYWYKHRYFQFLSQCTAAFLCRIKTLFIGWRKGKIDLHSTFMQHVQFRYEYRKCQCPVCLIKNRLRYVLSICHVMRRELIKSNLLHFFHYHKRTSVLRFIMEKLFLNVKI